MIRRPPRPTLFPYTTRFRSQRHAKPVLLHERAHEPVLASVARLREVDLQLEVLGARLVHAEGDGVPLQDRKSTRLNSSHANISYAVFCLKKKNPGTSTGPSP